MLSENEKKSLKEMANTVRGLSMDGIQAAKSGHPGLPMGCAELGAVLYSDIMSHNPKNSKWINRDRFILSAGHGSMFLYSLLHLTGYGLSLDEIKRFRQTGSKTPGHPEYGHTDGVETTTGPLGAGFSNAVGMAIAETYLSGKFNTKENKIIDHYTYVLSGDGCMMEGITSEAASLAGHLELGKLIVFYDSNRITIEGETDITFTEDVKARYNAYGWQTLEGNAYNFDEIKTLVEIAKSEKSKPTLIILHSIIGYGSPNKQGTHSVHGAPLGEPEIALTKQNIGLPEGEKFYVAPSVYEFTGKKQETWTAKYNNWEKNFNEWAAKNPELKKEFDGYFAGIDTDSVKIPETPAGTAIATRSASGKALQSITAAVPNLVGGSADLAPSNNTYLNNQGDYSAKNRTGKNFHFGVREHAMGGVANGILIYGGLRTFCATFLVFSDYMRPTVRLAALMRIPQIFVFTHDSIFVGEDGPTHQPIEHVESLRIIPDLMVVRPGDAEETAEAWKMALEQNSKPTALILTRQDLKVYEKADKNWKTNFRKGAYIVKDTEGTPDVVILATGSEINLALSAAELSDKKVRVVSIVDRAVMKAQGGEFLENLMPNGVKVVAAEAGVTNGWYEFADVVMGIDRFGICGPALEVAKALGLTAERLAGLI